MTYISFYQLWVQEAGTRCTGHPVTSSESESLRSSVGGSEIQKDLWQCFRPRYLESLYKFCQLSSNSTVSLTNPED